jgi:hypothetical protein
MPRKELTKKSSLQEELLKFFKKNNVGRATRNTLGVFFSPLWGLSRLQHHPRLTPWAAFFRRFAAGGNDSPTKEIYRFAIDD